MTPTNDVSKHDAAPQIQIDLVLLLRACGMWASLSREQQKHAKRTNARIVAIIDAVSSTVDSYLILPARAAKSASATQRTDRRTAEETPSGVQVNGSCWALCGVPAEIDVTPSASRHFTGEAFGACLRQIETDNGSALR